MSVEENLTPKRRLLKARIENELTSYRHTWVRNGSFFVRKYRGSKPIKIDDEQKLNELIADQNHHQHHAISSVNERLDNIIASSVFPASRSYNIPLSHRGL